MFVMCLHQGLGFGLAEEDWTAFALVLLIPRVKECQDVFRHFSSDGDWFYSVVCLHTLVYLTMAVLILPAFSPGTQDTGSGVYRHMGRSPYWWVLHWEDQKKTQNRTLLTGKKKDISMIAALSWFGNQCPGSSPVSDFCSCMLHPLGSPDLEWGHWVIIGSCFWSKEQ